MLYQENAALTKELVDVDRGFKKFMIRKVKGKALHEYINPTSIGVFKVDGLTIACGFTQTDLPARKKH